MSYEQNLFVAGSSENGGKKENLYKVRTYYNYKFTLPKYMLNFLTGINWYKKYTYTNEISINKREGILLVLKERIKKYYCAEFNLKPYKVDIDLETGVVLVISESNLPGSYKALLEATKTIYCLYAEWRDEVVEEYKLYNRYKRKSIAA